MVSRSASFLRTALGRKRPVTAGAARDALDAPIVRPGVADGVRLGVPVALPLGVVLEVLASAPSAAARELPAAAPARPRPAPLLPRFIPGDMEVSGKYGRGRIGTRGGEE